jgi:predicted O-methyltransferase YrrM
MEFAPDEIQQALQNVEGWLNPAEGRTLFALAQGCTGRGVIVEIGSWKGKSTIWLARGSLSRSSTKIHAIDPHTGSPEHQQSLGNVWTFEEFKRNVAAAGVEQIIVPHVDFSTSVARDFQQPVEFIFVDGLHEYDGVKADFDSWFPKVIDGGWMAFHDSTCWDGVKKVVCDSLFKSRRFRRVRFVRSITYAQKVAQNTFLERVGNRFMLCAFLLHSFTERMLWRVVHQYLDFPLAQALLNRVRLARR